MSVRRFMLIKRGTMDETLVCVFPWERPILEEIHGGNAVVKTVDELCQLDGSAKVKKIPLPYAKDVPAGQKKDEAPSLREQFESQCRVSRDLDPAYDPETEFARLAAVYGMHDQVPMPVVEKVFGSQRNFVAIVRQFRGEKPPANENALLGYGEEEAEEAQGDDSIADMDRDQILSLLKKHNVAYPKTAGIEKLRDLAVEAVAG